MLMFVAILLTAFAGLLKGPWWVIFIGFGALTLVTAWERWRLRPQFAAVGSADILTMAGWTSAGHCLLAAGAAYGWGAVMRVTFVS